MQHALLPNGLEDYVGGRESSSGNRGFIDEPELAALGFRG